MSRFQMLSDARHRSTAPLLIDESKRTTQNNGAAAGVLRADHRSDEQVTNQQPGAVKLVVEQVEQVEPR